LALEWADGKSLADYVHRAGRLAPDRVARLVRQLADALGAAHQAGIIHRDLKPENIIYEPATEQVKLLDFGIARDAELPAEERLTRTGFFVGTLKYVAPEALSGELVDGRADIFSLATITYWLLAGVHPFSGRTPRELLRERSITRGEFVLASGGRSTFYIDARRTTMAAEGLAVIGALALERLAALGWRPDVVGGLTLGADPVAFAIAGASRGPGRG